MPTGVYFRTAEARRNIGLAVKGRKLTEEQKKNRRKIAIERGFGKWMKGRIGTNKGKVFSKEWRENLSKAHKGQVSWCKGRVFLERRGTGNHNWKGCNASKVAIHIWVANEKGRPQKCEHCGTEEKRVYDWANIDHKYRRVLEDYVRLCRKCHREHDYDNKLSNKGSKYGSILNK